MNEHLTRGRYLIDQSLQGKFPFYWNEQIKDADDTECTTLSEVIIELHKQYADAMQDFGLETKAGIRRRKDHEILEFFIEELEKNDKAVK